LLSPAMEVPSIPATHCNATENRRGKMPFAAHSKELIMRLKGIEEELSRTANKNLAREIR